MRQFNGRNLMTEMNLARLSTSRFMYFPFSHAVQVEQLCTCKEQAKSLSLRYLQR